MKKLFFIFIVLATLVSCEMGDPLDPAKGIDSQGDSTLFSGIVTNSSSSPQVGVSVSCYELDWNSIPKATPRWTVITDSDGKYYKRDDLKSLYYGVRVLSGADYQDIHRSSTVDYDSERQSPYDPVIIVDLQI